MASPEGAAALRLVEPEARPEEARGFRHPRYMQSLSDWGRPVRLPRSGGWVLERSIPGSDLVDALGPYPLLCCRDWSALDADLREMGRRWVSMVAVADPLADVSPDALRRTFPDVADPFKRHWVIDLRRDPAAFVHREHRRRARRAHEQVIVEIAESPADWIDDFERLYGVLIQRRQIRGHRAFDRPALETLLGVPGLMACRAWRDGQVVSMTVWLVDGDRAWNHLGASSPAGYEVWASYALFDRSITELSNRGLRWVHLGAGNGFSGIEDGLGRFKRRWASERRPAWLCGRIFDREAYDDLRRGVPAVGNYFPAYRSADRRTWS